MAKSTQKTTSKGKLVKPKARKQWDAKLSHKALHTIITIVITLFIIGGAIYGYLFFSKDTQATITDSAGTTSVIASAAAADIAFNEPAYSLNLPADWKKIGQPNPGQASATRKYSYQAGLKNADNRYLDVYVDALPLTMAVNRSVAVRSEGAKLSHGQVSDDCKNFTAKTGSQSVAAKWDGVDFLCDISSTRNIVGTSAAGSINRVDLTNAGFTKHSFFFVYTDHNYSPDYEILYRALDSFSIK